jgi:neutral trehalase
LGDPSANTWQAAAYESGLDNAPMYDSVPFNKSTHRMELADVGLQSLYIMDCESLADIAAILGEKKVERELLQRAQTFRQALAKLWHEPTGQYLNYRTDTKAFNTTTSPTTFYPLLIKEPNEQQATRMVSEHLQNKNEYAGPWILPSCPINHPAYTEQNYWRGRIWGPLNLLVYLGLRQYRFPQFQEELVAKSKTLLLTNYTRTNGYVYENYNAITGNGREEKEGINTSDNFYHWGALLGFISLIENGYMGEPLKKISR